MLGIGKNTQFDVKKWRTADVEEMASCCWKGSRITSVNMILLKFGGYKTKYNNQQTCRSLLNY